MYAVPLPCEIRLEPFGDPPAALPVLGGTLADSQAAALAAAGVTPGEADPASSRLVYGAHTWFTATCVRRLLAAGRRG